MKITVKDRIKLIDWLRLNELELIGIKYVTIASKFQGETGIGCNAGHTSRMLVDLEMDLRGPTELDVSTLEAEVGLLKKDLRCLAKMLMSTAAYFQLSAENQIKLEYIAKGVSHAQR